MAGLIENYKGMDYLGHFRQKDVLKKGHNQGAPGGDMSMEDNTSSGYKPPKPQSTVKTAAKAMYGAKDNASWQAANTAWKAAKADRKSAWKTFSATKAGTPERKAAKADLKQNFAGSWKKYQDRKAKEDSGGGFLSKITGAFKKSTGIPAMKKVAGKVGRVAKKSVKPF